MISSLSLVVHLSPRGYTINRDKEPLIRLDVIHDVVDVVHDRPENFIEPFSFENVLKDGIVLFCAAIEHSVQVDIEIIYVRHDHSVVALLKQRIPSCDPSVEIVDTHIVDSSDIIN